MRELRTLDVGGLACRYPAPGPGLIEATAAALRSAGRGLVERPVSEIVDALDAAAARLADPDDPLRRQADRLLPAATGYSPAQSTLVLDRMTADWRGDRLRALLRAELGDPAVLDGFVAMGPGRRARAYGARLAFHVFAGNVPGVAVTSMIRSLLVKSPVLGKLASGQPVLPVLFADAVASVDPGLAGALAVTYWPGGSEAAGAAAAEAAAVEAADLVVVYGGDAVEAAFRARVPPPRRLVVHGPRFSAGIVGRAALTGDPGPLARAVARSVAAFDQHGCVSPHALWVEDPGGDGAAAFAGALADALEAVEAELPRGAVGPGEAGAIQQERGAAELRGHATGRVRVFASPDTSWTVVLDDDPAFRPSCLNRFLYVHPVGAVEEALDALRSVGGRLQSVALAGVEGVARDRLAHALAAVGATRVTTFDALPWPPPPWHHDGGSPLRELLRWVDLEG